MDLVGAELSLTNASQTALQLGYLCTVQSQQRLHRYYLDTLERWGEIEV